MSNLQVWANIATIVGFVIAAISLGVSLYAKNKVDSLKIEINKIKGETNLINPVIENLTIYSEATGGKKNE